MNLQKQNLQSKVRSIGTDPEIFVFGEKGLIPAFTFLPHKDEAPIENGHKLFWDGFQAEWNYNEGKESVEDLIDSVQNAMFALQTQARKHNPTAKLLLQNVVPIEDKLLNELDEVFIMLGCMPSFNAYGQKGLHVKDCRKLKYRFAGGHLIFGLGKTKPKYRDLVKVMDSILGIWSVGAARHIDNPIRRQYYGLAGEFRTPKFGKTFGVEYRTLSNFWLASPQLMRMTWAIAIQAMSFAHSRYAKLWAADENEVQETINYCDVKRANEILERNKLIFQWLLKDYPIEFIYTAQMASLNGVEDMNLQRDWELDAR